MEQRLELIYIKANSLMKYDENPRLKVDDKATEKLERLIRAHGFQNPLQVYMDNGKYTILCGNHRFEAGIRMGMEDFPCIEYSGTKEAALARAISDNKSNEWTDWDLPKLSVELRKLDIPDFDMELTGLSSLEIQEILGDEEPEDEAADIVPEVDEDAEPVTRPGDLWIMGEHRLLCGDATSEEDVKRLMNGKQASLVFTDPPYGMRLNTDFTGISEASKSSIKAQGKNYDRVIGDDKDYDPAHIFRDFGYCKEIFLWGADYYAERLHDKNKGSWFIWDKRAGIEDVEFSLSEFETCWSRSKHHRKILRYRWFGLMGTESPQEDIHCRVHPNQKPVKMFLWFINKYSDEGDIVVDLFLGSGSTLITCEKAGRACYGMEIYPQYCDVILKRWAEYTKEEPVRHDGIKWSDLNGA